ncbi:MAG TPA: indole-3-glycerol phosphate synthase TrpC [Elusimicrobiota bacterium]|jgi:indole-3-glycerol phosphate synthase|nr:indole-3-glycerol phosphate synthase TrpC [Elusimicrobiota bacterium]
MTNSNVLHNIGERTRKRVELWKRERPEETLALSPLYARKPLSLARALRGTAPRIIAEVKFASPSGGYLREPGSATAAETARIAGAYRDAGAAAISILTEPEYFSGDLSFLMAAREALPDATLLMKDFFIDVYQLELARSCGADAVLLIASLLGPRLHEMLFSARARGLSTLVEVHDEAQAEAALKFTADVIGVNSRDLRTLRTDLGVARRLAPLVTKSAVGVAESGLSSRAEIDELSELGYKGFLIGGSLMKSPKPGLALSSLIAL